MRTEVKAVVGTNAWGDSLYGKMLRGSYVVEDVIREAVQTAIDEDIAMFDTARDYGLGKGRPGLLVPGEWHLFLGMGGSGRRNACSSKKTEKKTIMKILFGRKRRKLYPLYRVMREIGKAHRLSIPQVAMSYVSSKGIVPICGCRKPYQVKDLAEAVKVSLSADELEKLEKAADKTGVKILGADMFRFAVKKGDRETRYKDLTIREFTKAADVYESGHAGIYEMCKDDYPFIAGIPRPGRSSGL